MLEQIKSIADLKKINDIKDLEILANDIRELLIQITSKNGGHLGANLGVVELTIALHKVFNSPEDNIIWDVGHQSYVHKLFTLGVKKLKTLRQQNGVSGFTSRQENKHDIFGAGHSSTSLAAAMGIAKAKQLLKDNSLTIAIIGDASIASGMAFEALNNIANMDLNLLIILNDNGMSIAKSVGGFSHYLANINTQNNIFTDLGLNYKGVIDGHNCHSLITTLEEIKSNPQQKATILHIKTIKGKGDERSNQDPLKLHGVNSAVTEELKGQTATDIYANFILEAAKNDEKIIALTAAMANGTGLIKFSQNFPNRFIDSGISEQFLVTFAGGLATLGYKPFVSIYSTFLQRAYDQLIHDIDLQKLNVKFIIDRAGLVGEDGATHAGLTDTPLIFSLPNTVLLAPTNKQEMLAMLKFMQNYAQGPIALRYPKDNFLDSKHLNSSQEITLGKGEIILEEQDAKVAILGFGATVGVALNFTQNINQKVTVANMRFIKPLDNELIIKLAQNHQYLIVLEENFISGIGAHVTNVLTKNNLANTKIRVFCVTEHVAQGTRAEQLKENIYSQLGEFFNLNFR